MYIWYETRTGPWLALSNAISHFFIRMKRWDYWDITLLVSLSFTGTGTQKWTLPPKVGDSADVELSSANPN